MKKKYFRFSKVLIVFFVFYLVLTCPQIKETQHQNSGIGGTYLNDIYSEALYLFNTSQYEQAIIKLKSIIEADSFFIPAYASLVSAFQKQQHLVQAESYFKNLTGNKLYAGLALWALGLVYTGMENFDLAADNFKKAITGENGFDEPCLALIDLYFKYKKENAGEIESLFNTLINAHPGAGYLYLGLGYYYTQVNMAEKALLMYDKAISLTSNKLNGYFQKANLLQKMQKYSKAVQTLEKALDKLPDSGDLYKKSQIYTLIGLLSCDQGNNKKSIEYFNKTLLIMEKIADINNEAKLLLDSGKALLNCGDIKTADEYNQKALSLNQKTNNKLNEMNCTISWGRLYKEQGYNKTAIDNYNKALALIKATGTREDEEKVLLAISECYLGLQDYQNALDSINRATAIASELKEEQGIAISSGIHGKILAELGDYETAIEYLNKTLQYFSSVGEKTAELIALWNIGLIYTNGLEDYDKALPYFEKALSINSAIGKTINDQDNLSGIYNNIGYTQMLSGNFRAAGEDFRKAYEIVLKTGNKQREAYILINYAIFYFESENYTQSYAYCKKAVKLGEELKKGEIIQMAFFMIGKIYHAQGDYAKAENNYKQVISLIETRRNSLTTADYKIGYFQGLISVYETMISLQFDKYKKGHKENDNWLALFYTEKAKARTLLDMLKESDININPVMTSEFKDITEIRNALVTDKTLLIEYKMTKDELFAWAITQKDFKSCKIMISQEQLQKEIISLRKYIIGRCEVADFSEKAYHLYKLLLEPVLHDSAGKEKILISPDGILNYLPFDVLMDANLNKGNQTYSYSDLPFLLKKYAISYCPSLNTANIIREQKNKRQNNFEKDLFGIGDPVYSENDISNNNIFTRGFFDEYGIKNLSPLIYSGVEIRNIAKLFTSVDIFEKAQATKAQVLLPGRLMQYRFIHFAAHGILNENKPELSGILLAGNEEQFDDNVLKMGEIYNIKINADLVVLSACNTGLGKIINGEGVVGFIHSWLFAGASSVMTSLWSIDDKSTAYMMEEFYKNIKLNMNFSEALRQAKLGLIKMRNATAGAADELYANPYYWAGFILTGTE